MRLRIRDGNWSINNGLSIKWNGVSNKHIQKLNKLLQ